MGILMRSCNPMNIRGKSSGSICKVYVYGGLRCMFMGRLPSVYESTGKPASKIVYDNSKVYKYGLPEAQGVNLWVNSNPPCSFNDSSRKKTSNYIKTMD